MEKRDTQTLSQLCHNTQQYSRHEQHPSQGEKPLQGLHDPSREATALLQSCKCTVHHMVYTHCTTQYKYNYTVQSPVQPPSSGLLHTHTNTHMHTYTHTPNDPPHLEHQLHLLYLSAQEASRHLKLANIHR